MKKLKYLLFILPFFFGFNVFAAEVDVTSNCYGSTGYARMYGGDEVQYQTYSNYSFGTTYQYRLSSFETELRYNLSANTVYTITFNTNNSNDFRNNFRTYNVYDLNNNDNNLVTGFTFVSAKKVQISFKTTSATNKVKIQMGGSNVYDNITGETNWNIKNAILTIPETAPSGSTSQDVIDNATQNTNNIINNNNQNTQYIINNQNDNTNKITNSIDNVNQQLGTCYTNLLNQNGNFVSSNATYSHNGNTIILRSNGWGSTYIDVPLTKAGSYTVSIDNNLESGGYVNVYYVNPSGERGDYLAGFVSGSQSASFTTNKSNGFLRVILGDTNNSSSIYTFWQLRLTNTANKVNWVQYDNSVCTSKLDDTNSAINDVNDSINNSNVDSGTGQGFFDNFTSQDFGLSQIITIPLNTIQGLTSKSCVPLQVPIPFTNSNISLPCMTEIYESKFPSIYNLWKIVSFGIVAYLIAIDIFHIVKGFKDPESDKVEVLDL